MSCCAGRSVARWRCSWQSVRHDEPRRSTSVCARTVRGGDQRSRTCTPSHVFTANPQIDATLRSLLTAFSDLRFKVRWIVAQGRRVVAFVDMSGTHDSGPWLMVAEPTHRPLSASLVLALELHDQGLIVATGSEPTSSRCSTNSGGRRARDTKCRPSGAWSRRHHTERPRAGGMGHVGGSLFSTRSRAALPATYTSGKLYDVAEPYIDMAIERLIEIPGGGTVVVGTVVTGSVVAGESIEFRVWSLCAARALSRIVGCAVEG